MVVSTCFAMFRHVQFFQLSWDDDRFFFCDIFNMLKPRVSDQ